MPITPIARSLKRVTETGSRQSLFQQWDYITKTEDKRRPMLAYASSFPWTPKSKIKMSVNSTTRWFQKTETEMVVSLFCLLSTALDGKGGIVLSVIMWRHQRLPYNSIWWWRHRWQENWHCGARCRELTKWKEENGLCSTSAWGFSLIGKRWGSTADGSHKNCPKVLFPKKLGMNVDF